MDTPDVTTIQKGAGGAFVAVALAAPHAGYSGGHLDFVVVAAAFVAAVVVAADAHIRRGRSEVVKYSALVEAAATHEEVEGE